MGTYPSENTQGFASLLYVAFVIEKRYRVDEVAPLLDVSPSTLYDYISGRRIFPPDLIAPLYNATKDRRFLALFLDECGCTFTELPEPEACIDETVLAEAIRAQEEFTDVLRATREALRDDRVDRRELAQIEQEYSEAKAQLARLMATVRASSRRRHGAGAGAGGGAG